MALEEFSEILLYSELGVRKEGRTPLKVCKTITLKAKAVAVGTYALTLGFYPTLSAAMSLVGEISEHTIGKGAVWVGGDLYRTDEFPHKAQFYKTIHISIDGTEVATPKTQPLFGHYWYNITPYLDKLSAGTHTVCAEFKG